MALQKRGCPGSAPRHPRQRKEHPLPKTKRGRPPDWPSPIVQHSQTCARPSGCRGSRRGRDKRRPAPFLTVAHEVDRSVEAPSCRYPKCDKRLRFTHARHHERSDQVETHATQICYPAKSRNQQVLDRIMHVVLVEG